MSNPFFKNHGPLKLSTIANSLNININDLKKNYEINDIKDLLSSSENDITFFHSKKYKDVAKKTKASFCITTRGLKNDLPNSCIALIVENVLLSAAKITSKFYPEAINDDGSCFTTELGCMNQDAPNYDPEANTSDNSCISWKDYSQELELVLTIYENMLDSADILISDLTSTNDSITNLVLILENQETFIEVDSYIDMPQGWSMFGYTCPDYKNVVEAFSEISNNIEIVKDEWGLAYLPAWNFNAFDNLVYGEGYQIKMIQEVNNFQFCPKIIVE